MNKFIIFSILFYSIYCSYETCIEETTSSSQCKNHDIEFNGFSCYKLKVDIIDADDGDDGLYCYPFPDKSETQKKYRKFIFGYSKELASSREEIKKDFMAIQGAEIFKEETYSKDDTITFKLEKFSNEDKKIINGNKTCSYLMSGRYVDNIKKYPSGYPNIKDKNICQNAEQFSDLKGLANCGLATINYTTLDFEIKNFSTCYFIPDNKFPKELEFLWRYLYFPEDNLWEILDWEDDEYEKNIGNKGNKIFKKSKNKRKLDSILSYEIIVEDKFGKKVKYSSNSTEIEVIEKGDENATSFSKRISIYQKMNLLFGLLLLLIL